MIKAVVFDWGGVLVDEPLKGLLSFCANILGTTSDSLQEIWPKFNKDFHTGNIPEQEFWKNICTNLQITRPIPESLWKQAVQHVFVDKKGMYQFVSDLRMKGYKTGILSNTEIPTTEYFYENGYERYFEAAIFSCIEKCVKPEEKIYCIALEKLHVTPEETVFIDDKLANVESARKLGIHSILFKNLFQLKQELLSLGVDL